jgi:hypothetical protein
MSYIEDYNMKIEVIKAIPYNQIKIPNAIPVGIYIQEVENLYRWCQADKEKLTAKGLDWKKVEDLPIRCEALREAESKWFIQQSQRRAYENIFLKEARKGHELKNELIHHFNYAFRDKSSLIVKVKEIAGRKSHEGMVKGLYALYVLGHINHYLLTDIGFDLKMLDLAAQMSNELATKKDEASFESEEYLEAKNFRNRAYTHLKEAVDTIYDCGKYVFCNDTARLKGYGSNHIRSRRMRLKRSHNVPVPESSPEQLAIGE